MAARQPPKLKAAVQVRSPLPPLPTNVVTADDIPDEYIKANYVLSEHRKKKKKYVYVPLIKRLVDFLSDQDALVIREEGAELSVESLKNAFLQIFPSEHGYNLYPKIRVFSERQATDVCVGDNKWDTIGLHEILLWREETVYETDDKVIKKLKAKAFKEAPREAIKKVAKKKKAVKKKR
jgi:hypothetical protein